MRPSPSFIFACAYIVTVALGSGAKLPVCIIGAGPAGLAAARELEDQGKSVVIFEKRSEVGGKCQAVYKDGFYQPLGAILLETTTYIETLSIANETDVPWDTAGSVEPWTFDWKTGAMARSPVPSEDLVTLLVQEFLRYKAFWEEVFIPLSVIGYKEGVPADLAVPASEWLATNGYIAFGVVFVDILVLYGYGDYREVPMIYCLQFFTPAIIASAMGLVTDQRKIMDFHHLFVEFAKTIEGRIHLNAEIQTIDRRGEKTLIVTKSKTCSKESIQLCSSLVIAFPPTVPALQAAGLDLTLEEETLFSAVSMVKYYSSAITLPKLPKSVSLSALKPDPLTPVQGEGQPIFFQAIHPDSGVVNAWSWDASPRVYGDEKEDAEKALNLLIETAGKVNRDPNTTEASAPVTEDHLVAWSGHVEYFPHIKTAELKDGWYAKFDALQGNNMTFFASGLNAFESVEFAVRAGRDVVKSYMSDL